jgi:exopolyphosphatase / guanosine-5'-triphosphate,3'-diphosphate pyrophosphatase
MEPLVRSQNGPATSELFVRVAAIDQGTNTTRLLVADVEGGRVGEVLRRSTITRLGEGVDARRRLLPLPITRVRNCLSDYRRELESLGAERALLVATSAVRDAENGEAFLGEIEWSYGFTTRLLSGDEEAELTLRGVGALDDGTIVVDIGGGSTELISPGSRVSTDLGSVRLTERFLESDPPTSSELEALGGAIRSVLEEHDLSAARGIGVAGTVTSLAALDLGLVEYDSERVHGHRMREGAVQTQLERLAALSLAERRQVPGLEPERAPVIVAGAAILRETMRYLGLEEIEVSEHDILDGAALEAAALPEPVEGDAPPGAYTCC